jgi:hypothetical protein
MRLLPSAHPTNPFPPHLAAIVGCAESAKRIGRRIQPRPRIRTPASKRRIHPAQPMRLLPSAHPTAPTNRDSIDRCSMDPMGLN